MSMRPVAVIGAGKTPFGAFADRDLRSLAVEAGEKCLRNANLAPGQIESFFLGNFAGPSFVGQNHLAPYVSAALGIQGVPSTRVEAACASSGSALFHAWAEVAAGVYDVVMVVGVEKMTSQPTPRVSEILAAAGDCGGGSRRIQKPDPPLPYSKLGQGRDYRRAIKDLPRIRRSAMTGWSEDLGAAIRRLALQESSAPCSSDRRSGRSAHWLAYIHDRNRSGYRRASDAA